MKNFFEINFGRPEAEFDKEAINNAFFETEIWEKINRDHYSMPLIIGRKGAGKSAIALKLVINSEENKNYICLIPRDFRHVELRQLLSELISSDVTWQYIYRKVWEGIIVGQLINHLMSEKNLYYDIPNDLMVELTNFQEKCPFYIKDIGDSLGDVLTNYILKYKHRKDTLDLRDLRKNIEPYDWKKLIQIINDYFDIHNKKMKINFIIDGLDEYWDTSKPSLFFLSQLLLVAKDYHYQLKNAVRFVICLRDNIFRTLVDTKCIEYDKLESTINYLKWDGISLFSLISKRAYPEFDIKESTAEFKKCLPEEIEEINIVDYLSRYIINRPRDYINFFLLLQQRSSKVASISEIHIFETLDIYSSNRVNDFENEFGLTYPGIRFIIEGLKVLINIFSKEELLSTLEKIITNISKSNKAPELILHYGIPTSLALVLISVGVLGVYNESDGVTHFIHEFSESRVKNIFEKTKFFGVHPVYSFELTEGSKRANSIGKVVIPILEPDEYTPSMDYNKDLNLISEKTQKEKLKIIANFNAIKKGQEHYQKFEKWVKAALQICLLGDIASPEEQISSSNISKRFELIFDIKSKESFWEEIKGKYQSHRLYVECKNTTNPTDADIGKLVRDLKSLNLSVGFLVYRDEKKEPSKDVLDIIRRYYSNENRKIIILAITDNFLINVLRKNSLEKSRNQFNVLWRNHLERYLTV
jgi:hypothetical protein